MSARRHWIIQKRAPVKKNNKRNNITPAVIHSNLNNIYALIDDTNPFKTVFLDYYPQSLIEETMGEKEDLRFGDEQLQKNIEALKLLVKIRAITPHQFSLFSCHRVKAFCEKGGQVIPVPYCKRTRCAITVPFSERKSESTFRQEFMLAVLWLGSISLAKIYLIIMRFLYHHCT